MCYEVLPTFFENGFFQTRASSDETFTVFITNAWLGDLSQFFDSPNVYDFRLFVLALNSQFFVPSNAKI